jgi:hypothetical protein
MHSDFYFIEQMLKEKERQLIAEADRLRQIKTIDSTKNNTRKQNLDALTSHIKDLTTFIFRRRGRLSCGC